MLKGPAIAVWQSWDLNSHHLTNELPLPNGGLIKVQLISHGAARYNPLPIAPPLLSLTMFKLLALEMFSEMEQEQQHDQSRANHQS